LHRSSSQVRTDKLQPVIDAALLVAETAADPDERRARGPHSLAAVSYCRRLELFRHTPRRSNLAHQRKSFHAVEEFRSSSSF
jgi:hypothetical protein